MSKYLVSFGDSDKYAVEFPGNLNQFKDSDILKEIRQKVNTYLKEKFPTGNFSDIVPLHIEEASGDTEYPKLDLSDLSGLLKNAATQIGVENFTDKLNLNAPFDKL